MEIKLITAPTSTPVTLIEAKAHLNVLHSDDDAYITSLIEVVTAQAEDITSRQLMQATYELYMDDFSERIELPKTPLISVTSIEYIPYGSDAFSILDSINYKVNALSEPATIYKRVGAVYPPLSEDISSVKITFTCGYASADLIPKPLKQWILIRIATLYENREEVVVGTIATTIENDYNDYLISKYRVGRL